MWVRGQGCTDQFSPEPPASPVSRASYSKTYQLFGREVDSLAKAWCSCEKREELIYNILNHSLSQSTTLASRLPCIVPHILKKYPYLYMIYSFLLREGSPIFPTFPYTVSNIETLGSTVFSPPNQLIFLTQQLRGT